VADAPRGDGEFLVLLRLGVLYSMQWEAPAAEAAKPAGTKQPKKDVPAAGSGADAVAGSAVLGKEKPAQARPATVAVPAAAAAAAAAGAAAAATAAPKPKAAGAAAVPVAAAATPANVKPLPAEGEGGCCCTVS
jgi:hypothetical protein